MRMQHLKMTRFPSFLALSTFLAYIVTVSCAPGEKKDINVGSDGFSDCNTLCNPLNNYPISCGNFCKDYKFSNDNSNNGEDIHKFPWSVVLGIACPLVALAIVSASLYRYRTPLREKFCTRLKHPVEETGQQETRTEVVAPGFEENQDLIGDEIC